MHKTNDENINVIINDIHLLRNQLSLHRWNEKRINEDKQCIMSIINSHKKELYKLGYKDCV